MPIKRTVRNKFSRTSKKRARTDGPKITASAGRAVRESIRADMKNMKRVPRAPRKFSANGAGRKNGATKRSASTPVFKHPKTELEAAIQRYVNLFEFAPIAYVSLDRVGRIEEINLAAVQLLGGSRARLIGKPFALHVTKDDGMLFLNHLLHCRSSDRRVETKLRLKKRSGEIILAHLASSPKTSSMRDGAFLYQTAILDLTEEKRAEEAIRESEERYRTLFNLGPTAVCTIDTSGVIQNFNRHAAELWGREPALGDTDQRFCGSFKMFRPDGSFMPHDQCPMAEVVSGKKSAVHNGEVLIERPDGSHVTVLVNIRPLKNDQGEVTGAINCFYDITERKRAERRTAVNLAITRILSESPTLEDAVPRILRTVCEMLGWEVGDFWAPNPGGGVLRCLEVWGSSAGKFTKFKAASSKLGLARGIGLPGRIRSDLKPAWISDATRDNNVPRASIVAAEGLHAGFAFPISFGKNFVGVMEFFSLEIREPDEDLLKMFSSIGSQIGQFVQRKRAEEALQKSKELLEQLVRERTKALRMSNAELKSEIERRKGLEGEILAVSDREQQRLGQELHDGLCQHLTAVAFMARSVALRLRNHRVIDAKDIEKIAQLVNDAATDTRNLSRALHRVDVDAAGLITALQDLVDREIWRTPCRLHVRPSFHIEDNSAAVHLYRIARESVINANKHAQAREIVIKLERSQQGMVLRVIDDGVGVSIESKLQQGLGFHIMNYRAQLIGGRLKIERPKKGGTSVSCYFPATAPDSNKPVTKENGRQRGFPTRIGKALAALI
jgi:PAS domain S-box-containing protein